MEVLLKQPLLPVLSMLQPNSAASCKPSIIPISASVVHTHLKHGRDARKVTY